MGNWKLKVLWQCSLCRKEQTSCSAQLYSNKYDFQDHFVRYCHVCHLEFTCNENFKEHYRIHYANRINVSGKYVFVCSLCNGVFLVEQAFKRHEDKHNIYGCLGCPQECCTFTELCQHITTCATSVQKIMALDSRMKDGHKRDVSFECFACLVSCGTNLKNLYCHFEKCLPALKLDAGRSNLDLAVVRSNIQSVVSGAKKRCPVVEGPDATFYLQVDLLNNMHPKLEGLDKKTLMKIKLPPGSSIAQDINSFGCPSGYKSTSIVEKSKAEDDDDIDFINPEDFASHEPIHISQDVIKLETEDDEITDESALAVFFSQAASELNHLKPCYLDDDKEFLSTFLPDTRPCCVQLKKLSIVKTSLPSRRDLKDLTWPPQFKLRYLDLPETPERVPTKAPLKLSIKKSTGNDQELPVIGTTDLLDWLEMKQVAMIIDGPSHTSESWCSMLNVDGCFDLEDGDCKIVTTNGPYKCLVDDCGLNDQLFDDQGLHLLFCHNMYPCSGCDGYLKSKEAFEEHIKTCATHSCDKCEYDEQLLTLFELDRHCKLKHGIYMCPGCRDNNLCRTLPDFVDHFKMSHLSGAEDLSEKDMLDLIKDPIIKKVDDKTLQCGLLCVDVKFDIEDSEALWHHLSTCHQLQRIGTFFLNYEKIKKQKLKPLRPIKPKSKAPFTCQHCDRVMPNYENFHSHMEKQHKDLMNPFICKKCGASFMSELDLNRHHAGVHVAPKDNIKCHICPVDSNNIRKHYAAVHNIEPDHDSVTKGISHPCRDCNQWFWTSTEFYQHLLEVHMGDCADKTVSLCYVCSRMFNGKRSTKQHVIRFHPESECNFAFFSPQCQHCFMLFPTEKLFETHRDRIHKEVSDENPFQCSTCLHLFKNKHSLNHHQRNCVVKKGCDTCGKLFSNKKMLECHQAKSHKFKCKLCQLVFKSKSKVRAHSREVHPEEEKRFTCDECGEKFYNNFVLQYHKETHRNIVYTCEHCQKTFSRGDKYKSHLRCHEGKEFQCPRCPKKFMAAGNFNRHIKSHLGLRPFLCDICPMSFTNNAQLKHHVLRHRGLAKKACSECGEEVEVGVRMAAHMARHTKEFCCDPCKKVFSNKYQMQLHFTTAVHAEAIGDKKAERFYKPNACSFCAVKFTSYKKLRIHLNKMHSSDQPPECMICQRKFSGLVTLNSHQFRMHTDVASSKTEMLVTTDSEDESEQIRLTRSRTGNGENNLEIQDKSDISFVDVSEVVDEPCPKRTRICKGENLVTEEGGANVKAEEIDYNLATTQDDMEMSSQTTDTKIDILEMETLISTTSCAEKSSHKGSKSIESHEHSLPFEN